MASDLSILIYLSRAETCRCKISFSVWSMHGEQMMHDESAFLPALQRVYTYTKNNYRVFNKSQRNMLSVTRESQYLLCLKFFLLFFFFWGSLNVEVVSFFFIYTKHVGNIPVLQENWKAKRKASAWRKRKGKKKNEGTTIQAWSNVTKTLAMKRKEDIKNEWNK